VIIGHSLGTAIAGLLAAELGRENIVPRGVVFMSVRIQSQLDVVLSETMHTSL
jgi:hypothetical protein